MENLKYQHGGELLSLKQKNKIIDFSASINPFGLNQTLRQTLIKNFDLIKHYPQPFASDLKVKLAKYLAVKPENILVGNGSIELIYLSLALAKGIVNLVVPSFSEYQRAAELNQRKIKFTYLDSKNNFKLNCNHLYPSQTLVLANPNNPTANLLINNRASFKQLKSKQLIVDEAFIDFIDSPGNYSFVNRATRDRRIIVLRTLTKFFSLAGLRVGYLVAHKDTVNALAKRQIPWSCNLLAQLAAQAALCANKTSQKQRQQLIRERDFLVQQLTLFDKLTIYPSSANFLLLKLNDKKNTASSLKQRLLKKHILIRDCSNFVGLNYSFFRVAVLERKANQYLIKKLSEVLNG